jgi:hypothetical protein
MPRAGQKNNVRELESYRWATLRQSRNWLTPVDA